MSLILEWLFERGKIMEKSEKKLLCVERLANRYKLARGKFNNLHNKMVKKIIETNSTDCLKDLLDNYEIKIDSFRHHLNRCSDDILLLFLEKTYGTDIALSCIRSIGDTEKLREILQDEDRYLKTEKLKKLINTVKDLSKAIESKPVFYQFNLDRRYGSGRNKFVVGVQKEDCNLHIAWSSVSYRPYHRNIFNDMGGENFPKELRYGGYLKILNGRKKFELDVVLNDSSGDFGRYNHKILQKFLKEIKEELSEQLDSKINLKIEVSG